MHVGSFKHHASSPTEASLLFQNVKGMKRFYNYIKREEERQMWEREANPEDVEYFKCQEELVEQLLEQYTHVERVIGQCLPERDAYLKYTPPPPFSCQEQ